MISRSKRPSSVARAARCCERSAISSHSSRDTFHCSAISSALRPWWTTWWRSSSSGGNGVPRSSIIFAFADSGMWPMCSTPPPMATSCTPVATSADAKFTACCADPHWRSIVVAGVSIGRPACSHAFRPTLYDCSPYC